LDNYSMVDRFRAKKHSARYRMIAVWKRGRLNETCKNMRSRTLVSMFLRSRTCGAFRPVCWPGNNSQQKLPFFHPGWARSLSHTHKSTQHIWRSPFY
jgi:hypothetical protein